ncbi:MAG: serine/threonine protein kinase [Candidatus Fibromonas sp.]|jgi:serine/threonine protein kinase|nr:serine/threonine protein kinase [Candidatus Fibromonas sp.]
MDDIFPRPFNVDYELLGELGKGGMGSNVYKARHKKLNRIVALKVLDSGGDEEAESRFFSETQAMKDLNHQNLVTIFEYGKQQDKIFIAMTFVEGQSLADVIKKEKILPVKNASYIAWQIAEGLKYAHKRGVIHRDIKPSNIMMKEDQEICIIDFGISITAGSQRLTSAGMTMGTPEYMSPEQCQNRNVTKQSDIYSLGIVFYEMLSGDPPFTGGASLSILNRHLHEAPTPLRKKNPEVPPALEKIINKCLEKKTDLRYADFSEFIEDLKAFMNDFTKSEPIQTIRGKFSKAERIMFSVSCALLVLLLFVILLLLFKTPPKIPPPIGYLTPAKSWIIENKVHPGKSIDSLLFDGSLSTAWIITRHDAERAAKGDLITITFPKPTMISDLGIAIGDQSNWDKFQDFCKPKEIEIFWRNTGVIEQNGNAQSGSKKIALENKMGVQYADWPAKPVEVTELTFRLNSTHNESKALFAISEIRIFGTEL